MTFFIIFGIIYFVFMTIWGCTFIVNPNKFTNIESENIPEIYSYIKVSIVIWIGLIIVLIINQVHNL